LAEFLRLERKRVPGRILSEADRLEEFARRATSMYFPSVAAKLGSGATTLHREAILSGKASRTLLMRGFTGRLARGIHNQPLEEMNRPGVAVLPYPLQRALMRNLAVPAHQAGRSEVLALWAGQSAGLAQYPDVATLLQSLVNGVSEKLA
jgi:nitronate monooxygenase